MDSRVVEVLTYIVQDKQKFCAHLYKKDDTLCWKW